MYIKFFIILLQRLPESMCFNATLLTIVIYIYSGAEVYDMNAGDDSGENIL